MLKIVEAVITRSTRQKPADGTLRVELRRHAGLTPELSAAAARAMFAFYRWRGWLDETVPLQERISHAMAMDEQFASDPTRMPDEELLARAVPAWAATEIEVSGAWARTLQKQPRVWLRAKRGHGAALMEQFASRLGESWIPKHPALSDAVAYKGAEDLFQTPEFHAGEFELQDISSQVVGLTCDPKPGETWWDACAGEGGKMLHLSDLMENKGLIWASDRAEWRLKRLKLRAGRAQVFNYRVALWDGGSKLPTKTKFNGILMDAPCSGVGTWQRNPHARWTTSANDVRELAAIQKQLLANVAGSLKSGGKLVYAVCTLTRSETVEVADAFEKQFPTFKRVPLLNPLRPEAPVVDRLWLWPQDGGNGMFVTAWRC